MFVYINLILFIFLIFFQMKNILVRHTFEISSFLFFVGPMTLICILYVLIGVKLRKSKILHGVKRNGNECRSGMNGQTRVIRMLGKCVRACIKLYRQ